MASERLAIDLHIHSSASDGNLSPHAVLARAQQLGLAAVAITDHDTVDGVAAVLAGHVPEGLAFLPGVEITVQAPAPTGLSGSLHLLGYGIRTDAPRLGKLLATLQDARAARNPAILERLTSLGMPVTARELETTFPDAQLGRPHIAQMMVRKGYVRSIDDAFDNYLGNGKPAYMDKYRIPCASAMAAVREAGGISVLAHPGLYGLADTQVALLVQELKEDGLGGMEVYYPEHSARQTAFFEDIARQHGLLMTGGTDYHGTATPGIEIGRGRGDFHVPYAVYETLMAAL